MQRFIKPLAIVVAVLLVAGGSGLLLRSDKAEHLHGHRLLREGDRPLRELRRRHPRRPGRQGDAASSPQGTHGQGRRWRSPTEYKVPADAFAQIVPISVISDRYVQLHPPYTGGPVLEDGAVLEIDRTQIPAELDDVFKQLKKLLDAIEPGEEGEPGALGDLIVALNEALDDRERGPEGHARQHCGPHRDAVRRAGRSLRSADQPRRPVRQAGISAPGRSASLNAEHRDRDDDARRQPQRPRRDACEPRRHDRRGRPPRRRRTAAGWATTSSSPATSCRRCSRTEHRSRKSLAVAARRRRRAGQRVPRPARTRTSTSATTQNRVELRRPRGHPRQPHQGHAERASAGRRPASHRQSGRRGPRRPRHRDRSGRDDRLRRGRHAR